MSSEISSSDFIPYLHQVFCIYLAGGEGGPAPAPVELELISVTEIGKAHQPGLRNPFTLHFLGPAGPQYLLQHTYHFEHDQMGALDLFIVPIGLEAGRMRYEAIFN